MITGQDLITELSDRKKNLLTYTKEYETVLLELAQSEANYYKIKATRTLELKTEGMAASIINNVIKGDSKVNPALLDYLIKQALVEANKEKINSLKVDIKSIQQLIDKEWGNSRE